MSDVFISYARSTASQAKAVAEALQALGHSVWRDDDLPAHRSYADVIDERLRSAKAVVVIWSAEAVKSQWVRAEADFARQSGTLVQLAIDGTLPPLPFNQIQCAEMNGWSGDTNAPGWHKVTASIDELVGGSGRSVIAQPVAHAQSPRSTKATIAVMPFANLSGEHEEQSFASGLVEEIIVALSRVRTIHVVASDVGLSQTGKGATPQDIARQYGVRYMLEGSVRKAGVRVRIAVKLAECDGGAQIWANRFEGTFEDVFALQDKVALSVTAKVGPAVTEAEIRRAAKLPTDTSDNRALLLRAAALYRTFSSAGALEALELLDRILSTQPDSVDALVRAATCHHLIVLYGWSDDSEGHKQKGIERAHRALMLRGEEAGVLTTAAIVTAFLERDLDAATAMIDRAVASNPADVLAWRCSANIRNMIGATDLAIEHSQRAALLDPTGPDRFGQMSTMGQARFQQRRYSEAVAYLRDSAQQSESPFAYAFLAACYGQTGQTSAALEALERYRARAPRRIEEFARSWLLDPSNLKLFLDGIALVEGKDLTENVSSLPR